MKSGYYGKRPGYEFCGTLKVCFRLVADGRAIDDETYTEQLDIVHEVFKASCHYLINRNKEFCNKEFPPIVRIGFKVKLPELDKVRILSHPVGSSEVA